MTKRILSLILALTMTATLAITFASCGNNEKDVALKVGAILIGDETEGYSLAHMNGIEAAIAEIENETGKKISLSYKKVVPEGPEVESNAKDLIANGCTVVITNSYGHQFNYGDVIEKNPEVTFVAMTGDLAATTNLANYKNAFTKVFESRYVSGVVAGMKLKALIDSGALTAEKYPNSYTADGKVKIGYVGAFNYAEVVSGYTAFFLGIQSVYENVAMSVKYTNSWFSPEREAAVAQYLMGEGCVIIGQHADSTGAPAAVQDAHTKGTNTMCFSVGYNVSMLGDAPDVALTSPTNEWKVYYKTLFTAVLNGESVPTDWAQGYAQSAVAITELGKACADGTAAKVAEVETALKNGTLKVFDCSKFTVGGQHLTTYTESYGFPGECLKTENGVTFFDESTRRSAPYFDIRIDGITEIASDYTE